MCNFSVKLRRLDHQGTEKAPAKMHMVHKWKKVLPPLNSDEEVFVASCIFCRKCDLSRFSQCDFSSFRKVGYKFIGFFYLTAFQLKAG